MEKWFDSLLTEKILTENEIPGGEKEMDTGGKGNVAKNVILDPSDKILKNPLLMKGHH